MRKALPYVVAGLLFLVLVIFITVNAIQNADSSRAQYRSEKREETLRQQTETLNRANAGVPP